jgi:hypothetical protein
MIHYYTIIVLAFALVGLGLITNKAVAIQPILSVGPYKSGYAHGCSDATTGKHVLAKTAKGQNLKTLEFTRGYDDGYNVCSDFKSKSNPDTVEQFCIGILSGNLLKSHELIRFLHAPSLDIAATTFCGVGKK